MTTHDSVESAAPLDLLWQGRAIAALVLAGQGVALVLALAPGYSGDRLVYFGLASLGVQWASMLTLLGLFVLRRRLAASSPLRVAWVALGLLVGATTTVAVAALLLFPAWWAATGWWPVLLNLLFLALAIGLLGIAAFYGHWRVRTLNQRASTAELQSLQARVRPHFLFNTLNTAAALVRDQPEVAENLLLDLSDLFRAALSGPNLVPLRDELDLARRYLEIERLRFGHRLRIRWEQPESLPDVHVPALCLQPLVENAVRHGIEPSPTGGELLIKVDVGRRAVQILVQNPVVAASSGSNRGHAIGLASARARIEALSGGRARLETRSATDSYCVAVVLPYEPPTRPPPGNTACIPH